MRTIKFRAWDKVFKCWLKWIDLKQLILAELLEDERFVVVEYSGLKDMNGMEIYEGDLLRVYEYFQYGNHERELEYISVVEFYESGFLVTEPNETQAPLACFHNTDTSTPLYEIEVVGNIYQN